ncbi:MAG: PAS domain-containing protein [Gammaproteobacteria bacterium]|nr:PAS domain-containing protein [Gammaproteobacteria bacterium]
MQSNVDLQQLVEVIGDAVIASDTDGVITMWNPSATRIFGFTESEALGQSLDLIIPERQRKSHWDGYHRTMHTGETRYATDVLRVPATHKEGHRLSIAFTVALLYSAEKTVTGIVAVVRDETTRFNEERDLRKRLAELEAGTG